MLDELKTGRKKGGKKKSKKKTLTSSGEVQYVRIRKEEWLNMISELETLRRNK